MHSQQACCQQLIFWPCTQFCCWNAYLHNQELLSSDLTCWDCCFRTTFWGEFPRSSSGKHPWHRSPGVGATVAAEILRHCEKQRNHQVKRLHFASQKKGFLTTIQAHNLLTCIYLRYKIKICKRKLRCVKKSSSCLYQVQLRHYIQLSGSVLSRFEHFCLCLSTHRNHCIVFIKLLFSNWSCL